MIKKWYLKSFPTDELGLELNDKATFNGLFTTLDRYGDVYDYIGVADSVVRERLFAELAIRIEMPYDYIYEQWLKQI